MDRFEKLIEIMETLRSDDGCPWDKEQTYKTLTPYIQEEAHEVIDAIVDGDMEGLKEELGDLILQVVFLAQIASEEGHFSISDVIRGINEKLVRRHPHVFADESGETAQDVLKRWEEIKKEEKKRKDNSDTALRSVLDGVPRSLPALNQAYKMQDKARRVGFDFPNMNDALNKAHEELNEFAEAVANNDTEHMEEELGDALFALVNVGRFKKIDPERALIATNKKFARRFRYIEEHFNKKNIDLSTRTLEELDAIWNASKDTERKTK